MIELNDKQIAEFWHRSYATVDGLWFMKIEEKYGFDTALDIDDEVWMVLPKIQARAMKSITEVGEDLEGLRECLATKLDLEGFEFNAEKTDDNSFKITVTKCPWHERMVKSGRVDLSGKVGSRICRTEYSVWASEFGADTRFELKDQICEGAGACVLLFSDQV